MSKQEKHGQEGGGRSIYLEMYEMNLPLFPFPSLSGIGKNPLSLRRIPSAFIAGLAFLPRSSKGTDARKAI